MGFPLPSELISMVLEYVTSSQENVYLALYATINRDWQMVVERQTFSTLTINTAKRLAKFKQLSWSYRIFFVQKIDFVVELESYNGEARTRHETKEETQRNSKIFTIAIQSLFNTIATWPETETGIALSIQAQSPGDIQAMADKARKKRYKAAYLNNDLLTKRFEKSYLQFDESLCVQCLAVPIITGLSIGLCDRIIEPASSSLIASKLPRLYDMSLFLSDTCKWDPELRKRHRNNFANSLHLWPSSIRELALNFFYEAPSDENYPPSSTVEGNTDSPSEKKFSGHYRITISHSLFGHI
ncbi:unnamed protein product [Penicillium glandicola]